MRNKGGSAQRTVGLKTVEAHLADLRGLLQPGASRACAVAASVGSVLAGDVHAPTDLPTFATSAMDGYAVRVAGLPRVAARRR